jgi:hypothetical protein
VIANSAGMLPLLLIAVATLAFGSQPAFAEELPPSPPVVSDSPSPSETPSSTPPVTPPTSPPATPPSTPPVTPPSSPPVTPPSTPIGTCPPAVAPRSAMRCLPTAGPPSEWVTRSVPPVATPPTTLPTTASESAPAPPAWLGGPSDGPGAPSTAVQDTTYPPSAPALPPPAAGGVQVEGVALARNVAPLLPFGVLGGIFLASGGLLLAAAVLLLRRRGKHSY